MKARLTTIAALVAVFITLAFNAKGAVGVPGLPDSLRIGSEQVMLNSVVDNPNSKIYMFFACKNPSNDFEYGIVKSSRITFTVFQDFELFVRTNAWNMRQEIQSWPSGSGVTNGTTARLYVLVSFSQPPPGQNYDSVSERYTYTTTKDLGLFSDITTNSFLSIPPVYVRGVTWVTNLQACSIMVEGCSSGTYSNYWDSSTKTWTQPQSVEDVVGNALLIQPWYSTNAYRTRIRLTSVGSRVYTQDGLAITQAVMSLRPGQITVIGTKGSDTMIQSSTNLVVWRNESGFTSLMHTNQINISVDIIHPKKFFRAVSN